MENASNVNDTYKFIIQSTVIENLPQKPENGWSEEERNSNIESLNKALSDVVGEDNPFENLSRALHRPRTIPGLGRSGRISYEQFQLETLQATKGYLEENELPTDKVEEKIDALSLESLPPEAAQTQWRRAQRTTRSNSSNLNDSDFSDASGSNASNAEELDSGYESEMEEDVRYALSEAAQLNMQEPQQQEQSQRSEQNIPNHTINRQSSISDASIDSGYSAESEDLDIMDYDVSNENLAEEDLSINSNSSNDRSSFAQRIRQGTPQQEQGYQLRSNRRISYAESSDSEENSVSRSI